MIQNVARALRYTGITVLSSLLSFVVATQSLLSLLASATVKPTSNQVSFVRGADPNNPVLSVKIAAGPDGYPGIAITPTSGKWDLSTFGHVEAKIANTGSAPLNVALRVDNAGNWQDNPWDTEQLTIPPGQTQTIETLFGYSYGFKKGFALNPSAVVGLVIFSGKVDQPESFRVDFIRAAGPSHEKPPVPPGEETVKPQNGFLIDQGGPTIDLNEPAHIAVAKDYWDLRDATDLEVKVRNAGKESVTPSFQIESKGGNSDWISTLKPIEPGREAFVVVPFAHDIDLDQSGAEKQITSDKVKDLLVRTYKPAKLVIETVRAILKQADFPEWLGKRPPAPGDWVKTADDEFDGATLDRKLWTDKGENYYDKVTHWSPEDLVIAKGRASLRYEKKTGHQNDDPKRDSTNYAAGYLDGYDHFAQRYGYFEARMKVPTAPGLWPAFWMMPDRGPKSQNRNATENGGMEFDIMEHLSRWGPYRYNIAMHWDGYGKDHKSLGSDRIYVRPDNEGFLTCGLLWLPGELHFYCNGVEVLHWKSPRISNVPEDIMFTLPSGGWDNDDVDDAKLPADFVIDYVRVWQRKDLMTAQ